MKRFTVVLIFAFLLSITFSLEAQQLDSSVRAALDERLTEYFKALETEGTEVQKEECDFLISTAKDSLVRQYVALRIYDHYLSSPVMGSEAVALHVFDKWFMPGHVSMGGDIEMLNARIFADFNRQSMIGERAPELAMETIDSVKTVLFGSADDQRYAWSIPPAF